MKVRKVYGRDGGWTAEVLINEDLTQHYRHVVCELQDADGCSLHLFFKDVR